MVEAPGKVGHMATLQEALAELLRSKAPQSPKQEKTIEEEREVARQISKAIPKQFFPHDALAKKKQQREEMDEQTK
jgi:hypothetical protein